MPIPEIRGGGTGTDEVFAQQIIADLKRRNLLSHDGEQHIHIKRTGDEEILLGCHIEALSRKVQINHPCNIAGVAVGIDGTYAHFQAANASDIIECIEGFASR